MKTQTNFEINDEKCITVKAWKKSVSNSWHGSYSTKTRAEFGRNFWYFDWRGGNFFHVVLRLKYIDGLSPQEHDRELMDQFQKYITNLKRGKKKFSIVRYQAIKEYDTKIDGHPYPLPHLHLFIQIDNRSQPNAMEIFEEKWKFGGCEAKVVNSADHFKHVSTYTIDPCFAPNPSRRQSKQIQMTLPKEYLDCTRIKRVIKSRNFTDGDIPSENKELFGRNILRRQMRLEFEKDRREYHESMNGPVKKKRKPHTYRKTRSYRDQLRSNEINLFIRLPNRKVESRTSTIPIESLEKMGAKYNENEKCYLVSLTEEGYKELLRKEAWFKMQEKGSRAPE